MYPEAPFELFECLHQLAGDDLDWNYLGQLSGDARYVRLGIRFLDPQLHKSRRTHTFYLHAAALGHCTNKTP